MSKTSIIKIHCNNCFGVKNHIIKSKVDNKLELSDESKYIEIEYEAYMVIQCRGCNGFSFLLVVSDNLFSGDENLDHQNFVQQYPDIIDINEDVNFLSTDEMSYLPKQIFRLYIEVKMAFNSQSSVLAGIGLRTVLEAICIQQNIPGQNLKKKVENLEANGIISRKDYPVLDKLRLIGNVSAHEIKRLPFVKLNKALYIINHTLRSIYIHHGTGKDLEI